MLEDHKTRSHSETALRLYSMYSINMHSMKAINLYSINMHAQVHIQNLTPDLAEAIQLANAHPNVQYIHAKHMHTPAQGHATLMHDCNNASANKAAKSTTAIAIREACCIWLLQHQLYCTYDI